jgi:8-oxo-dGTP pyrophosphatase MutT (NUDIX family)
VRRSAHAILIGDRGLILVKHTRLESRPIWVTVGGTVQPGEHGLDAALERAALEQAGAVIDVIAQVLVLTQGETAIEHYFLATVAEMNPTRQLSGTHSSHAQDHAREIDAVAFTGRGLASIDLHPAELARYLLRHWRDLAQMLPH